MSANKIMFDVFVLPPDQPVQPITFPLQKLDRSRAIAMYMSFKKTATFEDVWNIVSEDYKHGYSKHKREGSEFKKLTNDVGSDIRPKELVGDFFSMQMARQERVLYMHQRWIDRDCSIPVGSNLLPSGHIFKREEDLSPSQRGTLKRRRDHESRYGAPLEELDADMPVRSREAADEGAEDESERQEARIDQDGFKIPNRNMRASKRRKVLLHDESQATVLVEDSQANGAVLSPSAYALLRERNTPKKLSQEKLDQGRLSQDGLSPEKPSQERLSQDSISSQSSNLNHTSPAEAAAARAKTAAPQSDVRPSSRHLQFTGHTIRRAATTPKRVPKTLPTPESRDNAAANSKAPTSAQHSSRPQGRMDQNRSSLPVARQPRAIEAPTPPNGYAPTSAQRQTGTRHDRRRSNETPPSAQRHPSQVPISERSKGFLQRPTRVNQEPEKDITETDPIEDYDDMLLGDVGADDDEVGGDDALGGNDDALVAGAQSDDVPSPDDAVPRGRTRSRSIESLPLQNPTSDADQQLPTSTDNPDLGPPSSSRDAYQPMPTSAFDVLTSSQANLARGVRSASSSRWTEGEDKLLLRGMRKNLDTSMIIRKYNLPDRTTSALRNRRKMLQKKFPRGIVPSDSELYESPEDEKADDVRLSVRPSPGVLLGSSQQQTAVNERRDDARLSVRPSPGVLARPAKPRTAAKRPRDNVRPSVRPSPGVFVGNGEPRTAMNEGRGTEKPSVTPSPGVLVESDEQRAALNRLEDEQQRLLDSQLAGSRQWQISTQSEASSLRTRIASSSDEELQKRGEDVPAVAPPDMPAVQQDTSTRVPSSSIQEGQENGESVPTTNHHSQVQPQPIVTIPYDMRDIHDGPNEQGQVLVGRPGFQRWVPQQQSGWFKSDQQLWREAQLRAKPEFVEEVFQESKIDTFQNIALGIGDMEENGRLADIASRLRSQMRKKERMLTGQPSISSMRRRLVALGRSDAEDVDEEIVREDSSSEGSNVYDDMDDEELPEVESEYDGDDGILQINELPADGQGHISEVEVEDDDEGMDLPTTPPSYSVDVANAPTDRELQELERSGNVEPDNDEAVYTESVSLVSLDGTGGSVDQEARREQRKLRKKQKKEKQLGRRKSVRESFTS